jgi:starch phosphorylase
VAAVPPARPVAYFSMEIAVRTDIRTYAGGLGVLAGDLLRAAADLGLPMIGVTLLHRSGYFFQELTPDGVQREAPVAWPVADELSPVDAICRVEVEGRRVAVRAWRHRIVGLGGSVPVLFLDTDCPENDAYDRGLTGALYGGDERYRLAQEVVLGIGGVRMLRALGHGDVARYHMNEGHSALLALELLAEGTARGTSPDAEALDRVRQLCVFTTHTPVPAGHDQFPLELARRVVGGEAVDVLRKLECCDTVEGRLNMTLLGLRFSRYVNGVTERHGAVSRSMFPGYPIGSITNGVHSATWTAPPFRALFDRRIPDWRRDNFSLRTAISIPPDEVDAAHREGKDGLVDLVNREANAGFERRLLTLGFARRMTPYKRPTLLFHDPDRLRTLARRHGGLQVVFAGKAHPRDEGGRQLIRELVQRREALRPDVRVAFLPDYDLQLALGLVSGVDAWLNTPRPPQEASGTSGMKAAHNGVPSLSVLDGWWREGCVEGVTGWAIGPWQRPADDGLDALDARDLYRVLDEVVLPVYRSDPGRWAALMRSTIAINASFFNAQRMLQEYLVLAYGGGAPPGAGAAVAG